MKHSHKIFYGLGSAIALLTLTFWFFGGMHLGWTHSNETRMEIDPVTSLEYPVIEKKFTPGVDFLTVGLLAVGLFSIVGYVLKRKIAPQ